MCIYIWILFQLFLYAIFLEVEFLVRRYAFFRAFDTYWQLLDLPVCSPPKPVVRPVFSHHHQSEWILTEWLSWSEKLNLVKCKINLRGMDSSRNAPTQILWGWALGLTLLTAPPSLAFWFPAAISPYVGPLILEWDSVLPSSVRIVSPLVHWQFLFLFEWVPILRMLRCVCRLVDLPAQLSPAVGSHPAIPFSKPC